MICLELLKAVSIIAASIMAFFGISSWRRELRGRRKMELAERTLSLFYQAEDAIKIMRMPSGYGYEGESRKAEDNENEYEKRARNNAHVMVERYKPYKEVFAKLKSTRYQFMALFDKRSGEVFEKLRMLHNRLFLSATRLAHLWVEKLDVCSVEEKNAIKKRIQREEEIFWDNGKNDKINLEIQSIIIEIENICVPILSGKRILAVILEKLFM